MSPGRSIAALGLVLGTGTLLLQFALTVSSAIDAGRSLPGAIVFFFSFFTILTNIGVVLVYLAELRPGLRFFREPVHRATLAAAIMFAMMFYHLMLARIWDPLGLFRVADATLHYLLPVFYLLWWTGFAAHRHLQWSALPRMLAYPVLYVIWVMARGAVVDEYPYPVLDVQQLGYPHILANIALLFVLFAALCAVFITIDRLIPARSGPHR
ncbi:Pr6Pr family membrane protein [Sphingomonas sp. LaA6.9]|uniref:Pr6Pr family membrane protein n=1 Tax=Sphingomonas sp. LaA6.9 TaxID=2919914 RepID=UPI001F501ADA|nr:Pr6Pr family membrane protein [Sphingomonas sp. LaA6.9]MCJ8156559.1 Pr6Pr family membrane protein [Sphingomonas sp. LaA6.9]